VVTPTGAARLGIHNVTSLVSRGVLLDLPLALGVDRLEPGHLVTPEDLDLAEAVGDVRVRAGDIVLLRTGQMQHFHAGDRVAYAFPSPGPGMDCAPWFHQRDVAAVATDTLAFEVFPCELEDVFLPVHLLHLVEMGMTQGQNWDLEALAADCAGDGQYDFLLTANPEPIVGGIGAPVAAVAIK
jgi:kynurenine formamidase